MKRIYGILLLFIITGTIYSQSVNVPLEYWGYDFFDRCETMGLCSSLDLRLRPMSRMSAAKILIDIEKTLADGTHTLSKADMALFEQLKGDFIEELTQLDPNIRIGTPERHFITHRENSSLIHLDLLASEKIITNNGDQYDPNEKISETTAGGILRGHLGGQLGFYADARNSLLRGSVEQEETFDVSQGSPLVTSGSNVFSDQATAYFIWERPWLRIQVGRDEMEWGPGYHSGLSLTRNAPPSDMIKLRTRFKRFAFTSVHLFLNNSLGPKYLTGHRFDIEIMRGLYLGGTETVVYGDRDVEMSYLNPIMPYHVAEHHLGDQDNNTMSVDFTLTRFPGFKLYGEFYIDDMTTAESLTRFYGNKFAFLTGVYMTNPFNIPNLDLRFEYSRVEPFVYCHYDSINIYSHYDKAIGHWLGPNGDTAFLMAGYQFNRDVRAELFLENIRKGTGRIGTTDRPDEGIRKDFLGGTVEKRRLLGFKMIDQIRRDLYVSLSVTYSQGTNLYQTDGFDSDDILARFELYLNY